MPFAARLTLVTALAALAGSAQAADLPTMLGASRDWTAYQANTGDGKVCYAVSSPTSTSPKKVRDPIYVIVSTWPGRSATDEIEVVPGYLYKDGQAAVAEVGSQKAELFTQNDGKAGTAWVKELSSETALVSAMRGGSTLTVTGVSKRGTKITDTYSLAGLGTALDRAHTACAK
jgi:invasion protein IalB